MPFLRSKYENVAFSSAISTYFFVLQYFLDTLFVGVSEHTVEEIFIQKIRNFVVI